ncbi:hypothetical protein QOT17_019164 [Balamuthia mandrillaris]
MASSLGCNVRLLLLRVACLLLLCIHFLGKKKKQRRKSRRKQKKRTKTKNQYSMKGRNASQDLRLIKYRKQQSEVTTYKGVSEACHSSHGGDWEDIVYRYYGDVDALKIYFIRASPGLIYDSDPLTPNICLDLDENEKIVALEVKGASHLLACHFYDRLAPVDGKSPMSLNCSYYREEDVVEIWFVNAQAPLHYDHEVMIELRTKEGHIAGFRFPNASTSLCRHTCVPVNNRNCLFSGSEQ